MDRTFLQGRIDATKALIVAYEDASVAIASGTIESYTLDTGQDRQTVTKMNIASLNKVIDSLYSRCAVLQTRLTGSGVVNVRPGW